MDASRRRLQFLSMPLLLGALALSMSACKVRYRRDVEPPGTPAKYQMAAGGFMRYDGYDDVAGDLEIASREYVKPGTGLRVRLVGVIHIGDIEYYKSLQKELLDTADVVLFEGVKYEGVDAPDLGGAYEAMGQIIGTGFQKDGIDYRAKNFVHCDITVKPGDRLAQTFDPAMMKQAQQAVGMLAMMKGMMAPGQAGKELEDAIKHNMVAMMAAQMGGQGGDDAASAIESQLENEALPEPLRQRLKEAAKNMKGASPFMPELPGMDAEVMKEILDKRNAYVMEALKARLDERDAAKPHTIAVFYGAAHMPGMEKDLLSWGFEPVETVWLKAWRINGKDAPIIAGREPASKAGAATARPAAPAAKPEKPAARPAKKREPVLF